MQSDLECACIAISFVGNEHRIAKSHTATADVRGAIQKQVFAVYFLIVLVELVDVGLRPVTTCPETDGRFLVGNSLKNWLWSETGNIVMSIA